MTISRKKLAEERMRVLLSQDIGQSDLPLTERWFEVARAGTYYDWRYGTFDITRQALEEMVANFSNGTLKVKVALDCNHDPDHKAMAWIEGLEVRNESLYAKFTDWTPEGEKAVTDGEYRYFSIEFGPFERAGQSEGTMETVPNVLFGIAMTNRPVLKGIQPTFCERDHVTNQPAEADNERKNMKDMLIKLCQALKARKRLSREDAATVRTMLADLSDEEKAEVKAEVEAVEAKAEADEKAEEAKQLAEKGGAAAQLAETNKRLAAVEGQLAAELAAKSLREEGEAVAALMLSETVKVGFPAGKLAEVQALVKKVGTENAKAVAAMLADVQDATGKTEEVGGGGAKPDGEVVTDAERKLAEERAKASGLAVHVELAEIIKAKLSAK